MPFKRTAWLAGCALLVLAPAAWLLISRVVAAPGDMTSGEYLVELDGFPSVLRAGQVYDGTVLIGFPEQPAAEGLGDGGGASRVTIGVLGRGIPEEPGEGQEGVEVPHLILCSSGVVAADVADVYDFPCRITAPPSAGPFVVTVSVAPTATGDTFEATHELTVAP